MKIGGFMIDMDGTVYKGSNVIPGAVGFIKFLKERNIPFVFLTNNSSGPRSRYYEKLIRMGFDVKPENVLTSNTATIRFLLSQRKGKTVYPVSSPEVASEMAEAGVKLVYEEHPDIVVLTFDRTITYDKINRAYRACADGAELIATHPDDLCPTEDSYDIDIGPFIRMFEQMCNTKATVIGKPNRLMLEMAAMEMGIDPMDTAMVGDRLYTDIAMAENAGTTSFLVLTGETSVDDLKTSAISPTYVVDSISDISSMLD